MTQTAEDTLLTFKEAMAYLKVSRSTLYRIQWSGKLPSFKVGSTWRFYLSDLRAYVLRSESDLPAAFAPKEIER